MLTYLEKKWKFGGFFTFFRFLTLTQNVFGKFISGCGYQNGLIFCIQPPNIIPQVPIERYFEIFVSLLKKMLFSKKKGQKWVKILRKGENFSPSTKISKYLSVGTWGIMLGGCIQKIRPF